MKRESYGIPVELDEISDVPENADISMCNESDSDALSAKKDTIRQIFSTHNSSEFLGGSRPG